MNTLPERLKELRKDRSQAEFSRFLGISSQQTYQRYEDGKTMPNAEILHRIATKCDVSVDWLLGIRDEKNIKFGDPDEIKRDTNWEIISELLEMRIMLADTGELAQIAEVCYRHSNVEGLKVVVNELLKRIKGFTKQK